MTHRRHDAVIHGGKIGTPVLPQPLCVVNDDLVAPFSFDPHPHPAGSVDAAIPQPLAQLHRTDGFPHPHRRRHGLAVFSARMLTQTGVVPLAVIEIRGAPSVDPQPPVVLLSGPAQGKYDRRRMGPPGCVADDGLAFAGAVFDIDLADQLQRGAHPGYADIVIAVVPQQSADAVFPHMHQSGNVVYGIHHRFRRAKRQGGQQRIRDALPIEVVRRLTQTADRHSCPLHIVLENKCFRYIGSRRVFPRVIGIPPTLPSVPCDPFGIFKHCFSPSGNENKRLPAAP